MVRYNHNHHTRSSAEFSTISAMHNFSSGHSTKNTQIVGKTIYKIIKMITKLVYEGCTKRPTGYEMTKIESISRYEMTKIVRNDLGTKLTRYEMTGNLYSLDQWKQGIYVDESISHE